MRADFYARYVEFEERHWWFIGRRAILLRLLDEHLEGARDREVLDVGCGTGRTTQALARFWRAQGVDTDPEAVRFADERGVTVQRFNGTSLPFADRSFDLVTALDVIEHIDDDAGMLREVTRVLRPGGSALVAVPAFQSLWGAQDVISHHKRRYRAAQLSATMTEAGLQVGHVTYFNAFLFPFVAAIRLFRRLRPAPAEVRSDFDLRLPAIVNALLVRLFSAEAPLAARHRLPFGISIAAIATRP